MLNHFLFRYLNSLTCRHDHNGAEDAEMGKCMSNLNVSAMDTRDSKGRGRFFPFQPDKHLFSQLWKKKDFWYWKYIYYPVKKVQSAAIERGIVDFHNINPSYYSCFNCYRLGIGLLLRFGHLFPLRRS